MKSVVCYHPSLTDRGSPDPDPKPTAGLSDGLWNEYTVAPQRQYGRCRLDAGSPNQTLKVSIVWQSPSLDSPLCLSTPWFAMQTFRVC